MDFLYSRRTYIKLPHEKKSGFPRHGSFLIAAYKVQQPHLKYKLDKLITTVGSLKDVEGDPKNFGDVLRHLQKKGFNVDAALSAFQEPGINEYMESFFYESCSQNGNKE